MPFFKTEAPIEQINAAYLTARMLGIIGTGFCSGINSMWFFLPLKSRESETCFLENKTKKLSSQYLPVC